MYKNPKAVIKIDKEIYNELKEHADTIPISVTKLLQFCLKDFLSDNNIQKNIDNSFIKGGYKIVKISLTNKEIQKLQRRKKEHGFVALKHECEFIILNGLRERKEYYTNIDIENFAQIRTELNSIGRNLNMVTKKLQGAKAQIEYKNLEKFLEYIKDSIDKTTTILAKEINKTKGRF
jgi:hypothetical protein